MSTTLSITQKGQSFYERAVLNALSKMDQGFLSLTLPNGQVHVIGDSNSALVARLQIKDVAFFKSVVLYGDIGFGEAYVDGYWETDSITNVIKWIILNIEKAPSVSGSRVNNIGLNLLKWINRFYHSARSNTLTGSQKNISEHYDLSNDFFELFLDPSLTYSSAYFKSPGLTLSEAQEEKYRRLAEQLHIQESDEVLEIGSGWGGNAIFLAKNYGCRVTSITLSREQQHLAMQRVVAAGLQDRVQVILKDYREVQGGYDKIVSIEMLEAVGHAYLPAYFEKCASILKPKGILGFQVITSPDSRYEQLKQGVDWIQKYIFPGSLLPSVGQLNKVINETSDLTLVDLKDLGLDYAKTLHLWFENFNLKLKEVRDLGFDERFIRKWNYYLNYCEAAFAMRNINVMQMIYTRPNNTMR